MKPCETVSQLSYVATIYKSIGDMLCILLMDSLVLGVLSKSKDMLVENLVEKNAAS